MTDVQAMQKFVDQALGIDKYSYPMQVNAPKPTPPFASVRVEDEKQAGIPQSTTVENEDGSVTETIQSNQIITYEILFTEGTSVASEFTMSFRRQDMLDAMKDLNIYILDIEPIKNESLTLQTNWEIRHGLLVNCIRSKVTTNTSQVIDEADVGGEFDLNGAVVDMNINIRNDTQ